MRRFVIATLLVAVSPVLAAPVSFFDSFEYADGVGDPAYAANWSVVAGQNRYPIETRVYQPDVVDPGALDGTKVAMSAIPAPAGGYGISHAMGPVEPTNESPLVVQANWHHMSLRANRPYVSFAMELSQGDVHAPPIGSAPLASPIPVIALGFGMGSPDTNAYSFFDGVSWLDAHMVIPAGYKQWNFQHVTMTFTDLGVPETQTGKHLSLHIENHDLTQTGTVQFDLPMPQAAWTAGEMFDTLSFRAFDGVSYNSLIDSVSVTGGQIIPEPAALALLGLAVPLMLRRRGEA